MITLSAISFNGSPTGGPSATFDELGGTIGRADTNQLVLTDPDRSISRMHAQVVFRSGAFAIVDRGSNPVMVNGVPVGSGREATIKDGDEVQIGGYVLSVRRQAAGAAAASASDPFADLLGPAAGARPAGGAAGSPPGLIDPLASFGFGAAPPAAPARGAAPPPPASASALGGIPDDWDPFAPDPVQAPAPQDFARSLGGRSGGGQFGLDTGAAAPSALIPDLPSSGAGGGGDSLDALFGLKPGTGGDPLANSMLDAPMAKPNMAASHDPLQSLNSAPRASGAALQDDLSDLQRAFIAPPAIDARPPAPFAPPIASPVAPPMAIPAPVPGPAAPSGAVLSWDNPDADGRTFIRPVGRAAEPAAAPLVPPVAPPVAPIAAVSIPAPAPFAAPMPSPAAPPAVARAPVASAAGGADADALLAAFREGLGVPSLQVDALTPELMRLVGQLLHESTAGTVDLLVARAALKREVRAESTVIVAKENNPLKFSPSAEAAMQHLLAPPMRGFMAPVPAMRDAYDDLRAHQFGFIAGMRAALAGVLARFAPAELEGRLTQRSTLKSLLPGSRKAAMWEVFIAHFEQISREAEDDFHSLFGKAFLKAYEEHIDQLHKDRS